MGLAIQCQCGRNFLYSRVVTDSCPDCGKPVSQILFEHEAANPHSRLSKTIDAMVSAYRDLHPAPTSPHGGHLGMGV